MKKSLLILFFFVILVGGAFLRFEHLGKQSYWMDEGYTVNAVISGMQNGTRNFAAVLDSGERYFCPMYCGLVHVEFTIFNLNPASPFATVAYRNIAAFFGILFILISYWIAKRFFHDRRIALLTMFFTSFSYIQIAWSRQARWYTELEVFFWLALGCFYLFLKPTPGPSTPTPTPSLSSKTRKGGQVAWLFASVVFTVAAILTHPIAYALPFIMLVWFVIERRPKLMHLIIASVLLAGFLAFMEFGLELYALTTYLSKHFSLHQNSFYYASFFLRNYWIFILLSIIGFKLANREQRKIFVMLYIPFVTYLIGLSFFTDVIEYRYLFHTTLAMSILGSAGYCAIVEQITQRPWWKKDGSGFKASIKQILTIIPLIILFLSGHLIFTPQSFYWLEADDPANVGIRPYYAYTPQPDFNGAYDAIKQQLKPDDLVISSHPHFNKIFLDQAGYWLAHDYMRRGNEVPKSQTREFYVNAGIIHDLEELKTFVNGHHGFVVFDLQSTNRRIPKETIDYIKTNFQLEFHKQTNNYSEIWVYRF